MTPKTITYPPEMLPIPDEGDHVQVVVVDPNTGVETVVYDSEDSEH